MEPVLEQSEIYSISEAYKGYLERFDILPMTKNDVEGDKFVAHFLTLIGEEVYKY